MVFLELEETLLLHLRKLGRKRTAVDAEVVRKRLTVEGDVELRRPRAARVDLQEQVDARADRALRENAELLLHRKRLAAHHREKVAHELHVRVADLVAGVRDVLRVEEEDRRIADRARADADRVDVAERVGRPEHVDGRDVLEHVAPAVEPLARQPHAAHHDDADLVHRTVLVKEHLLVVKMQLPHFKALAELLEARFVDITQQTARAREDDLVFAHVLFYLLG